MLFRRKLAVIFIAINLISLGSVQVYADNRDRNVTVMTRNLYLGTDFGEIFAAQTQFELITEVAEAYTDVQSGLPQARLSSIADEIKEASPMVVGLQEVSLWRIGAFGDPAASEHVTYDFLQILLDELAARGLHYEPVVVQTNLDAEVPAYFNLELAFDVRFTDRVVILVNRDFRAPGFKVEGTASGTFQTLLSVPTATLGSVEIQRGWTSADIKFRGKTYRFVNAHLEFYHPLVRQAQAGELLQGPANTSLSVILAGDFNADAETGAAAYQLLLGVGGFKDVWELTNPQDPGLTSSLFLVDPFTPFPPYERIDLILIRGSIAATDAEVVGEETVAPNVPIPSDHAGVVATVVLEP